MLHDIMSRGRLFCVEKPHTLCGVKQKMPPYRRSLPFFFFHFLICVFTKFNVKFRFPRWHAYRPGSLDYLAMLVFVSKRDL